MSPGRVYRHSNQLDVDMLVIRQTADYGILGKCLFVRWISRNNSELDHGVDTVTVHPKRITEWEDVTDKHPYLNPKGCI